MDPIELGRTWASIRWDTVDSIDPLWTPHREHARDWLTDNAEEIEETRGVGRYVVEGAARDEAFCANVADAARSRWEELLADEAEAG